MENQFKAGDKIVCVDDYLMDGSTVREGHRYTVSGIGDDGLLELEGFAPEYGFLPKRFKLVA